MGTKRNLQDLADKGHNSKRSPKRTKIASKPTPTDKLNESASLFLLSNCSVSKKLKRKFEAIIDPSLTTKL